MDFLFHFSTFNWRHSPKSLSSAETDLVESTTVQQLWAGVTTKKLILDIFSFRPNCQPRVSRSSRHTQVMLQTVTLFYIHRDFDEMQVLIKIYITVNALGHCVTDSMSITAPAAMGSPVICGTNGGYHSN
jgi:hypothetical protein